MRNRTACVMLQFRGGNTESASSAKNVSEVESEKSNSLTQQQISGAGGASSTEEIRAYNNEDDLNDDDGPTFISNLP